MDKPKMKWNGSEWVGVSEPSSTPPADSENTSNTSPAPDLTNLPLAGLAPDLPPNEPAAEPVKSPE